MLLSDQVQRRLLLTPTKPSDYLSPEFLKTNFREFLSESAGKTQGQGIKKSLLCLAKRGESPMEVWALIKLIESMENRMKTGLSSVVDVCGTGGDGMNTFNISTVAAFVIAGAGGFVAKHGNRAVSSRCGSSDLMESLGVNMAAGPKKMLLSLKTAGIAYLHAPLYHPLFAKIQPLRQALGVRTIFNLTGPFLNPFAPTYQMIGVSRRDQLSFFMDILKLKKMKHAVICRSQDGLDEISCTAPTEITELRDGKVHRWALKPADYGFKKAKLTDYAGGSAVDNKKMTLALLQGRRKGPARDVIELNAAMGIYLCGKAASVKDGIELARRSIDKKLAFQALQTLIRISQS